MSSGQLKKRGAKAKKPEPAKESKGSKGDLGFEAELFKAADKLRGNMEPSDYKHVALGLIFLKHISDSFEATIPRMPKTPTPMPPTTPSGCPRRRAGRIFRRARSSPASAS